MFLLQDILNFITFLIDFLVCHSIQQDFEHRFTRNSWEVLVVVLGLYFILQILQLL